MRLLSNICRIALAAVFIFSGFVKGIDPMGSVYKFTDYLVAFHLSDFTFLAYFGAYALALVEFLIGIALILRFQLKATAIAAFVMMCFFAPFSLYVALVNPVSDCGCFGDAFVISNRDTFLKNIILWGASWCVWIRRRELNDKSFFLPKLIIFSICGVFMIGVQWWGTHHLPIIDFRPYAIGKDLQQAIRPTNNENNEKISLIYKNLKTGELETFDETNIPWRDSLTYEYIETIIPNENNNSSIHGFSIFHSELDDISEEILADDNYTFLIISHYLNDADTTDFSKINEMAKYALGMGYNVYGITASDPNETAAFINVHQVPFEFCSADETLLKTMIRSNPGIIIMRNGTIIDKWSRYEVPDVKDYSSQEPLSYSLSLLKNNYNKLIITILILLAVIFLHKRYKRPQV